MAHENKNLVSCSNFEEFLTDYLDKTLENGEQKAMAEHALKCPICHSLLNDVKESLAACREIAEPKMPLTRLEARILERTAPDSAMDCDEFEGSLTDYLDGFLPAPVFHRWERHAVLCNDCTDLPGAVVRSLATLVAYKLEELPVPDGLHEKILQMTVGTEKAASVRASWSSRFGEWIREIRIPIPVPQFAPVVMMLAFAFLFISQTVSADGSLSDVYAKSYLLAEQTYQQGADAWNSKTPGVAPKREPVNGTTFVEDNR